MNIIKDMQIAAACRLRTNLLMYSISKRLANRAECRGQTYVLKITSEGSYQSVSFEPNIQVHPNIHKRDDCYKKPVIDHILNTYFSDFVIDTEDKIKVLPATFAEGKYIYTQWIFKNRRWYSLDSNKEISG